MAGGEGRDGSGRSGGPRAAQWSLFHLFHRRSGPFKIPDQEMRLGLRRGTGSPERKHCRALWSCGPTPGPLLHISPRPVGEPLPGLRRPSPRGNVLEPGALPVFRARAGWHQRRGSGRGCVTRNLRGTWYNVCCFQLQWNRAVLLHSVAPAGTGVGTAQALLTEVGRDVGKAKHNLSLCSSKYLCDFKESFWCPGWFLDALHCKLGTCVGAQQPCLYPYY